MGLGTGLAGAGALVALAGGEHIADSLALGAGIAALGLGLLIAGRALQVGHPQAARIGLVLAGAGALLAAVLSAGAAVRYLRVGLLPDGISLLVSAVWVGGMGAGLLAARRGLLR